MGFSLTEEEWNLVSGLPIQPVVDLAADLDVVAPEVIDRRALLEECVPRIVARGRSEGLPFSKYDREDLASLPAPHLAAIGRLQGLGAEATVDAVLRSGTRVYNQYQRTRPDNPVALCLPMLLTAVARCAAADAAEDARADLGG